MEEIKCTEYKLRINTNNNKFSLTMVYSGNYVAPINVLLKDKTLKEYLWCREVFIKCNNLSFFFKLVLHQDIPLSNGNSKIYFISLLNGFACVLLVWNTYTSLKNYHTLNEEGNVKSPCSLASTRSLYNCLVHCYWRFNRPSVWWRKPVLLYFFKGGELSVS